MNLKRISNFLIATALTIAVPAGLAATGQPDIERTLLPENAIACGSPVRDVTDYDLVGVSRDGTPHPDIPEDLDVLTLSLDVWLCMYPEEQYVPVEQQTRLPGMVALPPSDFQVALDSEFEPLWAPNGPYSGANGGETTYTILLPNWGDSLYPVAGCNYPATVTGLDYLRNVVGGTYSLYCYYLPNWNTGGNTDVATLLSQLDTAVMSQYSWLVDAPHELIIGIVKRASNMGASFVPAQSSIVAEVRTDTWDAPHPSVVMHEVGHSWGANHYPDESIRKYICQPTISVMNYCDMQFGSNAMDSNNRNVITSRYWRTS